MNRRKEHLTELFLKFNAANPHVYAVLEEAAKRHVDRYGVSHTSIYYLYQFARHEGISWTTTASTSFKLANDWQPYYSRLILHRHPEWDGLFVMRPAEADFGDWLDHAA